MAKVKPYKHYFVIAIISAATLFLFFSTQSGYKKLYESLLSDLRLLKQYNAELNEGILLTYTDLDYSNDILETSADRVRQLTSQTESHIRNILELQMASASKIWPGYYKYEKSGNQLNRTFNEYKELQISRLAQIDDFSKANTSLVNLSHSVTDNYNEASAAIDGDTKLINTSNLLDGNYKHILQYQVASSVGLKKNIQDGLLTIKKSFSLLNYSQKDNIKKYIATAESIINVMDMTSNFAKEIISSREKQLLLSLYELTDNRYMLVGQEQELFNTLTFLLSLFLIIYVSYVLYDVYSSIEKGKNELLEQRNLLNIIIENIPISFFAKDVANGYRWIIWNKKAQYDFELTAEQVLGKTDYDSFPKEEADFFRATDEKVMREGKLVDIPEESVTTNRGTWTAHTIKVPVYDEKGNPRILIGMLEDISDRKRQQDDLRIVKDNLLYEKNRLQTIMDSMLEGIITIDANGMIQSLNTGIEHMFGYNKDDLVNKNISILMPDPERSMHNTYLRNHKAAEESRIIGRNRELTGVRKSGEIFPIVINVKKLIINEVVQFIGIIRDISEQKARENELESARNAAISANALKSEFLANISHELRTPMHSIITFSRQGIERITKWGAEQHEENLRLIHSSGERLLLILNDLLDLSKLEAGVVKYDINNVNLNSIIKTAIRSLSSLISDKNLNMVFINEEESIYAECDCEKINQVIINLLSNAIKFTPVGKTITLKIEYQHLSQDGEHVFITVDDEGIGIPENEYEYIFDKFAQSSKTKTGAGGTGLGLAICKEIILGHNGRIWAENLPTGGAHFSILLPRYSNDKKVQQA